MDKDQASKAIEVADHVNYMVGTDGWSIIMKELEKEIDWAFNKSISPSFREEVKQKPEVYFEHYGYVNGLKQVKFIVDKINVMAKRAKEDLEKWESRKNQHILKQKKVG